MSGKNEGDFSKIPDSGSKEKAFAMSKIPDSGSKEKAFAMSKIPDSDSDSEPKTAVDANNVRRILQKSGFVRVDGLSVRTIDGRTEQIQRSFSTSNKWQLWRNNGMTSIRSAEGETWIGLTKFVDAQVDELIKEGSIEKVGYFVPLSNGEAPSPWDLYRRWRNPDWVPQEIFRTEFHWRP